MVAESASLISFAIITTFTPGPNNITSASMGLNYGYGKTFRYLLGIFTGFFLLMLLCAFLSEFLLDLIPGIEGILSIVGSIYILWLAWHTLKADYSFNDDEKGRLHFRNGLLLQLFNPKVLIYGLTVYSSFLADLHMTSPLLPLSSFALAFTSFASVSLWTLFGTTIRRFMSNVFLRKSINVILALLLVLTALRLSGLF